jgi:hypothetical protein
MTNRFQELNEKLKKMAEANKLQKLDASINGPGPSTESIQYEPVTDEDFEDETTETVFEEVEDYLDYEEIEETDELTEIRPLSVSRSETPKNKAEYTLNVKQILNNQRKIMVDQQGFKRQMKKIEIQRKFQIFKCLFND